MQFDRWADEPRLDEVKNRHAVASGKCRKAQRDGHELNTKRQGKPTRRYRATVLNSLTQCRQHPPNLHLSFGETFFIVSIMGPQEQSTQEPDRRGDEFDLQPHLVGDVIEVRPLRPGDWEELFAVASDPLIWEQHPASDRYREEVFREFFREALESGGALVVIERASQKIIGSSRYFGFDPVKSEIEIGWTFLARSHWGGKYNGELKRLMLDHAFKYVGSVVFLIGPNNLRSQKAVEKIGALLMEGRTRTDPHGKTVEHHVYEIRKPTATS